MTSRVRALFEELLSATPDERQRCLSDLATREAAVAAELRELLRNDTDAGGFLERDTVPGPRHAMAGQRLGRFVLVRPLGSGGMGAVWEAEQEDPRRRVALKLQAGSARTAEQRWRFEHEMQVLATLQHPAIATFFEAGTAPSGDGELAWFAMELVPGAVDLLTWAKQRAALRERRLAMFLTLCAAVAHGHRHGVVHRDLKPGNVLVGSDDRLKLIDFGIARATSADADAALRTRTGDLVGTLHYMAPEQLRGDRVIGPPGDVYALGVLLYQLLCDEPPFQLAGRPLTEVARIVLEEEPIPPRRRVPDLPQDLAWIVLRALAKEPGRRYGTVDALAADLERFRAHLPVEARAAGGGYRARKFVRRHRAAIAIGVALVAGAAVGGYGLWQGLLEAREGERLAQAGEQSARAGEAAALRASALSREVQRVTSGLFDAIDETAASRDLKVHELLDSAFVDSGPSADPEIEQAVRAVRGGAYRRLGRHAEARREYERALALQPEVMALRAGSTAAAAAHSQGNMITAELGLVLAMLGERERGERMLRAAVDDAANGGDDDRRVRVLQAFCRFLAEGNAHTELLAAAAGLRGVAESVGDEAHCIAAERWTATAAGSLQRHDEAVAAADRAFDRAARHFGADSKFVCEALGALVTVLQDAQQLDRAEGLYPDLIARARRLFGDGHGNMLTILNNHAQLLMARGKRSEAVASMREIVAAHEAKGPMTTAPHLQAIHNLGMLLNFGREYAEAEPLLARAAVASTTLLAADNPEGAMMRFNHGACLAWMNRFGEAEAKLLGEYERLATLLPGHGLLAQARRTIADAYASNGRPEEAAAWRGR